MVLTFFVAASTVAINFISSSPPGRNEPKNPFKRKILAISLIQMTATVWLFVRLVQQNSLPEIILDSRQWRTLKLEPEKNLILHQEMSVHSGTAKNTQFYAKAFKLYGEPSAEQQKEAVNSFRKLMVDFPGMPETHQKGTVLFRDDAFNFDKVQLDDLISGRATIYAMAFARYQNNQGLIIETPSYSYMEKPPSNGIVGSGLISWHLIVAGN